jgi:hypothetical protein
MATTLGTCVQTVHNTYATAIKFIAQCAGDLINLGIYGVLAAIPVVDFVTGPMFVMKVIDKLTDFVKNVGGLIGDATTQIGSYKSSAISFATNANNFKQPEQLPDQVGNPGSWRVVPNN